MYGNETEAQHSDSVKPPLTFAHVCPALLLQELSVAQQDAATKLKSKTRKGNVFSRLFAPTASFLARMTGKGPSGAQQVADKSSALRQSMMGKILNSPAVSGGLGQGGGQGAQRRNLGPISHTLPAVTNFTMLV